MKRTPKTTGNLNWNLPYVLYQAVDAAKQVQWSMKIYVGTKQMGMPPDQLWFLENNYFAATEAAAQALAMQLCTNDTGLTVNKETPGTMYCNWSGTEDRRPTYTG